MNGCTISCSFDKMSVSLICSYVFKHFAIPEQDRRISFTNGIIYASLAGQEISWLVIQIIKQIFGGRNELDLDFLDMHWAERWQITLT